MTAAARSNPGCEEGNIRVSYGDHTMTMLSDEALSVSDEVFDVWRWVCSCGGRGRWQNLCEDVSYRGWLNHVRPLNQTPDRGPS